jgi:hypothetical protein
VTLKKRALNTVFIAVLVTWVVSLLAVSPSTSSWMTPTIPLTINNYILTLFVTATGLASATSFFLGLDHLKAKPRE